MTPSLPLAMHFRHARLARQWPVTSSQKSQSYFTRLVYTAPVEEGEKALIRSTDSSGRAVTVEGTLYDDPLRGNYGLVNLDQAIVGWVDNERLLLDTNRASEVDAGQFVLSNSPKQIAGSEVEVGTKTENRQFDLATGDLNGDNRSEEILAWRPSNVAGAPIHFKVGSLPGETNLLASEPVAQYFNGKLYLMARGYDDALWIGVDTGNIWQWQRCGGTLASGPAVLELSADTLEFVAVGTNGKLSVRNLSTGGAAAWTEFPGQPTVTFEGTPALAQSSSGTRHLLARDTNNTVWHATNSGSGFENWQNLGGYLADGVAATGYDNGKVALLVRGFDDALWYRLFDGSWGDWMTVGISSDFSLASTPTALATGNTFEVYARANDDSLRKIGFNGSSFGAWQTVGIDATVGSRPAVTSDGAQSIVYAARPDNGVLQRSDNGANWTLVNAVAPGSTTYNTNILPLQNDSEVVVETGHFLQNGRAQVVLGYVNASSQVELKLYDVMGGLALDEIGGIVLPTQMTLSKAFDLTTGDFDGDGSAEIAVFSASDHHSNGTNQWESALVTVIDWDNTLQIATTLAFNSGHSAIPYPHVAIEAGDFDGSGKDDLTVGYSWRHSNNTPAQSVARVLSVDDTTFVITFNTPLLVNHSSLSSASNLYIDIATGDVNGSVNGVKEDEIIVAMTDGSNYRLGDVKVLEVAADHSVTEKTNSGFDTNNRPFAIDVGDLDRDLIDEVALVRWRNDVTTQKELITWEVDGSASTWVANLVGRRLYPVISGSQYGVALALGDVTGESLRVGAPTYRLQQNVGNLIAIINAPPTHLDNLGGNPISIGYGEADTYARYSNTQGSSAEVSFDSKRTFSFASEAEITVGDPEGTHVTGSLGASYGSEFENGREELNTQTINETLEAINDDFAIFSGTSYQIWEYPLFNDNSGVPASHINVIFPVPNSEVVYQGGQRTCNGSYLPTHQVHNIWSYTPVFNNDDLIGYSPNNKMYESNVIAPGGGTSSWTFNMANNLTNRNSSSVRLGITAGLETQIGGDSVDVGVNVGIFSASKKVTTPLHQRNIRVRVLIVINLISYNGNLQ